MRYLVLMLALSGCATIPTSSVALFKEIAIRCKATKKMDEQRLSCIYAKLKFRCKNENLDLRVCGHVDK